MSIQLKVPDIGDFEQVEIIEVIVKAGDKIELKINLSKILKDDKSIIEDLIVAAHNDAKSKIKTKTAEEINKATGGFGIPGFKWPL